MYILSNELKSKMGLLIEYYRAENFRETKEKKWVQNYFIRYDSGDYICSDNTYMKLKQGKASVKDELYDVFLMKLGVTFKNMTAEHELLYYKYSRNVLEAVMKEQVEDIVYHCDAFLGLYQKYLGYFYFKEYGAIMEIIKKRFQCNLKLTKHQYEKLLYLVPIYQANVQVIVKHLLFEYLYEHHASQEELVLLGNKLAISEETNVLMMLHSLYLLSIQSNGMEAYRRILALMPVVVLDQNYSVLASLHAMQAALSVELSKGTYLRYIVRLDLFLAEHKENLLPSRKSSSYRLVAITLFEKKMYKNAYLCFSKCVEVDPASMVDVILYLEHIEYYWKMRKVSFESSLITATFEEAWKAKESHEQYQDRFVLLYDYVHLRNEVVREIEFTKRMELKDKNRLRVLTTYVVNNIMPNLYHSETRMIDMFQYELDVLAEYINSHRESQQFRLHFLSVPKNAIKG